MTTKKTPNVLPDGALKAISHNDLIIAKLKHDAKTKNNTLEERKGK